MSNIAVWKIITEETAELIAVDLHPTPTSLDMASERLPGGAYTTLRTFHGDQFLRLQEHLDRLAETVSLSGMDVAFTPAVVRDGLRRAINLFAAPEKRVRITLDMEETPGTIYLTIEQLQTPGEAHYQNGVSVVTRMMHRNNPKAKLTEFINTASQIRQSLPADVYEAIQVGEDGRLLEGLSSNFFAVKDGSIWTADAGVLSGITRSIVLEEAAAQGIIVHLDGYPAAQLDDIDEAFITSASRAVLPVTRIDGKVVGSGKPGAVSRLLLSRYLQRIEAEIKPA